tara:strand:+ start:830 stop:1822 length:993 start_codon:yes stop_codon:yes gene_type:complete
MNYFKKFDRKPFVIAEIGSNYDQNFEKLKKLITEAKNSGADAVKIQLFNSSKLYPNLKSKEYRLFKKLEFKKSWFERIQKFCEKIRIEIFASSFDKKSTEFLIKKKVNLLKFASSEADKLSDIIFATKFNKPTIYSTGMSEMRDIFNVVDIFNKFNNQNLCLMYCCSLYPPKDNDLNLSLIKKLIKNFNIPVGFSDHTIGSEAACVAVGLGATIFEKHITLDRNSNGPDHYYATQPHEFKNYVSSIKKSFKMRGNGNFNLPMQVKINTRRSSLYWKKNLSRNSIIKSSDIILKKNTFLGLPKFYDNFLVGQKLFKNVKKDQPVQTKDLKA